MWPMPASGFAARSITPSRPGECASARRVAVPRRGGGQHVEAEADARDEEPDRVHGEVGDGQAEPHDDQPEHDREHEAQRRPCRDLLCRRRRHHEEREDEQRPGDLTDLGGRAREQDEEPGGEQPDRDPAGPSHVGVDAGEEQRPGDRAEAREHHTGDQQQHDDLLVGHAEEGPEQQTRQAVQEPAVEADEEGAARQRERLHRPDDGGLLLGGLPAGGSRDRGDDDRRRDRGAEVADRRADPDQDGSGGPREGDDGEGVTGEALPAEHHEPADRPGQHGDDRPGAQRVDHERLGEHLPEIVDDVPGQARAGDHLRSPVTAARCCGDPSDRPGLPAARRRRGARRRSPAPRWGCRRGR